MTDRPIIFSAPMVRALLDGRKTQTRRVLKPQPEPWKLYYLEGGSQRSDWHFELGTAPDKRCREIFGLWGHSAHNESIFQPLPYAPGDRLYVRETWGTDDSAQDRCPPKQLAAFDHVGLLYRASAKCSFTKWRPSTHMPRWASRITLTVTEVRVERVQDISEEDAKADGFAAGKIPGSEMAPRDFGGGYTIESPGCFASPAGMFQMNWIKTYGYDAPSGWDVNPWIVAVTFSVHLRNIDELEAA